MKTYILILLQVLIHELILSQVSEIKVDSICLYNLNFINEDSYNLIEKELSQSLIIHDTLMLSVSHTNRDENCINNNKLYLYIIDCENYNSYIHTLKFKGYFYIHNICILVESSELVDEIKLFDVNNSVSKYFSYTYQTDYMPSLMTDTDIEFIFKINTKKNNSLVLKRKNLYK